VESYRTAGGPRHRTVAYLGELSACEKHGWARLAAQLDSKAASKAQQQLLLFESLSEPNDTEPVPDQVEVNLESVRVHTLVGYAPYLYGRSYPEVPVYGMS
jgi:hypothetical protein